MKRVIIFVTAMAISLAGFSQSGDGTNAKASFYSKSFNGRKTATGETYWDHLLTAASNIYKLGTRLLVVNKHTGKKVEVVVNDRMAPHMKGRVDLSRSAFQKIASVNSGVVPVKVYVLDGKEPDNDDKTL
ncbi:septal ring lytic transglycosylase RlpA family protein [Niabella drilacis]|uniref:Rare lipoprotein A n=1 Tax=Niabella drilacis (strain DSM 25811 / CCM 8410 / CCUG 62505 / LMG 26954 / E90) TaxID=1285928 RepID=A0A1G6WAH8_NIADE|nr:septal ring lytic transglycosylase RlpA family protein [Niabella drilacis]SDD62872.1 rare lipoprotein A [Niabella drilacis]